MKHLLKKLKTLCGKSKDNTDKEMYRCEHLSDIDLALLKNFKTNNPYGQGLINYLKLYAMKDELNSRARTYVVIDNVTDEVCAYFTLKANSVHYDDTNDNRRYSISGIELSAWAVNDAYREAHPEYKSFSGRFIFVEYIIPAVKLISEVLGAEVLMIYAINQERLLNYYASLGFLRLPKELEDSAHSNSKPDFDRGCVFMYIKL